ncbi:hypothetical protein PQQ50_35490, partial [Paraburkholderia graminis]
MKTLQNMVYRGEIHEIATGGMPKVRREAEAYLEERKLAREIRRGRFASTECAADKGKVEAAIRAKYQPKIDQGWPDILQRKGKTVATGDADVFTKLSTFHGEVVAMDANDLAGKSVYRAFGKPSTRAPGGSSAAGYNQPSFWGLGSAPKDAEEWRVRAAVLDEWNGNGCLVVAHFPADLAKRMPEAKAWAGQIAEQFGIERPAQYLEGGGKQLVIDMGKFAEHINVVGERVKETEKAESM